MTLKAMRAYLQQQQTLLNLSHWSVKLRWMNPSEAEQWTDTNGVCSWIPDHPSGVILIHKNCKEIKKTITHELLHLRIEGFKEMEEDPNPGIEQAIHAISELIY